MKKQFKSTMLIEKYEYRTYLYYVGFLTFNSMRSALCRAHTIKLFLLRSGAQ